MKTTRDLMGLNVFSVQEGRILGKTAECVVDLAAGTVVGLIVELKPGEEAAIARKDITAVGRDAVMVASDKVLKPLGEAPGFAQHRTSGKTAPQVLTKSGQVLGVLGLVHVDEKADKVVSYEIAGDLMQAIADGPATVGVLKGTIHGADAIVLPDSAVTTIKRPGGLRVRLEKAVGAMRDTATQVGGRMTVAAGKVRSATEAATGQAVKKAKAAAEVVEDRAGDAVKAVKGRIVQESAEIAPQAAPKKAKAPTKAAPRKKAAPKKAPK